MTNAPPHGSRIDAPRLIRWRWLMLAATAALAAVQVAAFHGLRHDDAFISYRYGQNLAAGNGLVFNEGEYLMGSTSPAHVLIAAALYNVVGQASLPGVMSGLGSLAWMAQAVALYMMFRGLYGRIGRLAIAAALAVGGAFSSQWVALETNIAVALTLVGLAAAIHGRWCTAAGSCALAGLVRPDAYLVAMLVGAAGVMFRGRRILKPAFLFMVLAMPWPVFAIAYFGSPFPQSAAAKYQASGVLEYGRHLFLHPATTVLPLVPGFIAVPVVWGLVAFGAFALVRRNRRFVLIPLYGLMHLAAYGWLRPILIHEWHLYPLVVVATVLLMVAIVELLHRQRALRIRLALVAGSVLLLAFWSARTFQHARSYPTFKWNGARHAAYIEAASYLRKHALPEDAVASLEVGTLAYYTGLRMHDWGGLVTRDPKRYSPGQDLPYRWIVADTRRRGFMPSDLHPVAWFAPGDYEVRLYDRRPRGPR